MSDDRTTETTAQLTLPVAALPVLRRAMAFVDFAAGEGLGFSDPGSGYEDGAEEIMFDLANALDIQPGEEYPAVLARFGLAEALK